MEMIISPEQLKAARQSNNVSQAALSKATGVPRSYVSRFEGGKQILPDETLIVIRDYFEEQRIGFDDQDMIPEERDNYDVVIQASAEATLRDGFMVPPDADQEQIERDFERYHSNSDKIESLLKHNLKESHYSSGFFGSGWDDEAVEGEIKQVLQLMAENYVLIQRVQGNPMLTQEEGAAEPERLGQFVADLFELGNSVMQEAA